MGFQGNRYGGFIHEVVVVDNSEKDHLVRFFDYDGTLLKEQWVYDGDNATAPTIPTHSLFTFFEWNYTFTGVTENIDVGAIYDINDGETRVLITLNDITGLGSNTIGVLQNTTDLMTIHWGDGETSTGTATGFVTYTKPSNYPSNGDYVIRIETVGTYRMGRATFLLGSAALNARVTDLYTSQQFGLYARCLKDAINLKTILIGNGNTGGGANESLSGTYNLNAIITPKSLIKLGNNFSQNSGVTILSLSETPIDALAIGFGSSKSLDRVTLTLSPGKNIETQTFTFCSSIREIIVKGSPTKIFSSAFSGCTNLKKFKGVNTITEIEDHVFLNDNSLLSVDISTSLITLGNSVFSGCLTLPCIILPDTLTTIGALCFSNCFELLDYQFLATTPPTLSSTNVFTEINPLTKIYVPDASVAAYKSATNWITYANYIFPLSTRPI